jgi:hypothetical protein
MPAQINHVFDSEGGKATLPPVVLKQNAFKRYGA